MLRVAMLLCFHYESKCTKVVVSNALALLCTMLKDHHLLKSFTSLLLLFISFAATTSALSSPKDLSSKLTGSETHNMATSVIRLSYKDLVNKTPFAISCAKRAFCERGCFGALSIYDIPEWKDACKQVLNVGKKLALDQCEEAIKARKECQADVHVGPGWLGSPGKETHSLQSGYYANLKNEEEMFPHVNNDSEEVWSSNRWPSTLAHDGKSFQQSVKSAGKIMYDVSLLTLDLAQTAAVEIMAEKYSQPCADVVPNLRDLAERSNFLPSRLVYYDAKYERDDDVMQESDSSKCRKYWLPWHLDFNLATAFAPALWIKEDEALSGKSDSSMIWNDDENSEKEAGLMLRNPDGSIVPAAIGRDCILIQLGAHAQLVSGSVLKAGPHAVAKKNSEGNLGRLLFGLFVYGAWESRMKPSAELLKIVGEESILEDDFACLMEKAYTGDTVLKGYKAFETYMNS